MLKDKNKGGYDSSTRGYEDSGLTYDESTRAESSTRGDTTYNDSTRRGDTTYNDSTRGSTTNNSEYGIEILDESESDALETVPEDEDLSVDDESTASSSPSDSESYFTGLEDEEAGKKGKGSRCPKRYPLWLCPPFWFMHPKKAYRNRTACIANLILIGCSVYYLILVDVDVENATVTQYLWLAPTMVILYTAHLIKKNLQLSKVVVLLAERVQQQINVQNEMADDINKLGEKGRQYRQEVVNLRDVIAETKLAGKRLAWRNQQSIKEVDYVDEYISKYKPPKTVDLVVIEEEQTETAGKTGKTPAKPKEVKEEEKKDPDEQCEIEQVLGMSGEMKTQGKIVVRRQEITTKRVNLNQRIDEHEAVLDDVKEGISMLQDYHDEFTNESETMKDTLSKFTDTVEEFDTQMGRLEDLKEYSKSPMDASNADMFEYLTEIHKKRERLRKITVVMEISILRDRFLSRQYKTGETGMSRETFESIKREIPAAAQRAIRNMETRGTFDVLRGKSKKKIMDSKLGRKKRPGIDTDGMKAFLDAVEDQMRADMTKPLKSLLKPNVNIET